MSAGAYRADVPSQDAWSGLGDEPRAVLIDVRTRAEWTFVGVPDLSSIGKEALLIEWQRFPAARNDGFVGEAAAALSARGADQDTPVYFLCRSGGRSAAAAAAMTAAGYRNCINVSDGFEGALDAGGHRGVVQGWKAAGLPWVQS